MQVSKQLLRTLPARGISYVLASVKEAVNLVGAAQAGLAIGIGEVPALPGDPTLDYIAYSTQTDRLFRIHADHRFHFMPINIGAKRRSGFPSNRLIGMPST